VADVADPAIPLVRGIMANHPTRSPRLLVGDVRIGRNPKVQNLMSIYDLARHELVLMCDSNVQLPRDALAAMAAQFAPDVGMVSAVPVAVRPGNFVAELECAMSNGYGARWLAAAAALGLGVAVGKILFVRKSDLDRAGGLAKTASHPCEDRAIENALRSLSRRVVMAHAPVDNPVGVRRFRDFLSRHQRYMWCRRTFSGFVFYIEPMLGAAGACLAGSVFCGAAYGPGAALYAILATLAGWFLLETLHLRLQGWHMSWHSPAAWLARECLLPFLWVRAVTARTLRWQDAEFEATVA
jgi:ceramide glucosyltransferase